MPQLRRILPLLLLTLLFASSAQATRLVGRFDLEGLSRKAAVVVRGRVLSQEARWDEAHERIYTWSTLQVLEFLRGPQPAPKRLVVKQIGGTVGDLTLHVDGRATLAPGEEVVLFLRAAGDVHTLVGMANGKYTVERLDGLVRLRRAAFPEGKPERALRWAKLRETLARVPFVPKGKGGR